MYIDFTWPNCHVILNVSVKQILIVPSKLFCGDSHSDAAFHFFAPIFKEYLAAPAIRIHEVPRPVRVRWQGGWVRNGLR